MGTEKRRINLLLGKYLGRDDVRDIEGLSVGVWRAQAGYPAHGALLSCIISLMPCIKRRGHPFSSQRTPACTVQKPEFSASRPPEAVPQIVDAARLASFWGTARRETRVIAAPDAVIQPKSTAEGSRWLKKTIPARMQPPRLAENSRKCTARPGGPVRATKNTPASKRMRARKPDGGKGARQRAKSPACPPGHRSRRASAENLMPCVDVREPIPRINPLRKTEMPRPRKHANEALIKFCGQRLFCASVFCL